jgi:GNAT superfamily N-acetyltransferase
MLGGGSPNVAISRIGPADGAVLREVRLRGLAESPDAFGQSRSDAEQQAPDEWNVLARQAASGNRRAVFFARTSVEGGSPSQVLGVVLGRRRPPDTVMVFSMWVDPDARRSGIGRRLIEAVERWAAGWGANTTVLWVFATNEPAIRFYRCLGFELQDAGPDAEAGAPHGALAMRRSILR